MIVTITPNPALDVTYAVPELAPGRSHRVTDPVERAGGKGLNVASVLAAVGHRALVLGPVGGARGEQLRADLDAPGIAHDLSPSPVATRQSVAITDPHHGATILNEVGEAQPPEVWDDLSARLARLLRHGGVEAVAVCGSLPPHTRQGLVADIVRACRRHDVPTLLDISGPALTEALTQGPDLVKPNDDEAAATTGARDPLTAARRLRAAGAHIAAVSCGADGLVVVTATGAWRARLAEPLAGNPTGAGDALAAGLAVALAQCRHSRHSEQVELSPEVLRRAVAWSAAAVLEPVAGALDPAAATSLESRIDLQEIA